MSKKLLNKTLKANLIFSVLLMAIAAPAFYFITEALYLDETDETLQLRKTEFMNEFNRYLKVSDIAYWNKINRDLILEKSAGTMHVDSLFFETNYDSILSENEHYRVLKSPVIIEGENYLLSARISLLETKDLQENVAFLFACILLFLLVGFYFITRHQSNQLWQPFYKTLQELENFEIDKNTVPVFESSSINEFERLNQVLNKWIIKNRIIFNSQREFVENAAHELQTPLAVFQAKIDTLIQTPNMTSEHAEVLDELNQSVNKLNKLNRNLLLLSKLESNSYIEIEPIVLNEIIDRQIYFFKEQALSKNIKINIHQKQILNIKSNPVLSDIFISNLFLNAIKHNVPNGYIEVEILKDSLRISNTGLNEALDQKKLFMRFAKLNPGSDGNGLGLAIVNKIAIINGWQIHYTFNNAIHRFDINFKRQED